MDNLIRNSHKQVTLQDLLKVKKLEKPDEDFWENFDQELSQRTLKTIVYKDTIRSRLSQCLLFVLKPIFPLTALALLTLGIFSYNTFSKFPHSHSIIADRQVADNKLDFTLAKKNFVKASIAMDATDDSIQSNPLEYPSACGIRYLAGSMNAHLLGQPISTIY